MPNRLQTTFPDRQTMRSRVPREQFPITLPTGPNAFDVLRAVRRPGQTMGQQAGALERAPQPWQGPAASGYIPTFGRPNPPGYGGGYGSFVPGMHIPPGGVAATGFVPPGYAPPSLPQNAIGGAGGGRLFPSDMEQNLSQAELQRRMPSPMEQYQPVQETEEEARRRTTNRRS